MKEVISIHIYTETHQFDDYIENVIRITNNTDDVLTNIELSLDILSPLLLNCKVIRERGSLTQPLPLDALNLGNLYPNESANIHCKFTSTDSENIIESNTLNLSYNILNESLAETPISQPIYMGRIAPKKNP